MSDEKKAYLGDGLYVEDQGFQFKLYTEEGQAVYLDEWVMQAFFRFIEKTKGLEIKMIRKHAGIERTGEEWSSE